MKCKELKKILEKYDDDVEINIKLFNVNKEGSIFLNVVDDCVNDCKILLFASKEEVIR